MKRLSAVFAISLVLVTLGVAQPSNKPKEKDGILFQYVGQVTNSGTDSAQYGNLLEVAGQNTTSNFTFYTSCTTVNVVNNGSIRVINRVGTTTIYAASSAGDFSNPDSFRSGTPVQVSDLKQQVIVDTATGAFTVLNFNTITSVASTGSDGDEDTLGEVGQRFRTVLTGHLNPGMPPPSGWFGGYALSVK